MEPTGTGQPGQRPALSKRDWITILTAALASVVVRDGARLLFADFPAKFRGEGEDIWRVDDGGELDPQYIRVVFLLRRGASIVLGIDWAGTEGNDLSVFVSDVDRFTKAIEDYWYRAPE